MLATKTPAEAMLDVIQAVTGDWCRQRKAEERDAARKYNRRDHLIRLRRITTKEAAWQVMRAAYEKASGGGRRGLKAISLRVGPPAVPRWLAQLGGSVHAGKGYHDGKRCR
jgi:hypothetical protein